MSNRPVQDVAFIATLAVLLAQASLATTLSETLALEIEGDWQAVRVEEEKTQSHMEFVRPTNSPESWKEKVLIEHFFIARWGSPEPAEVLARLKADRETACPGATRWVVLREEPHRILYEAQADACGDAPVWHELGLLAHGQRDRFHASYVVRSAPMQDSMRVASLRWFENAEVLARHGEGGQPAWGPESGPPWVREVIEAGHWTWKSDRLENLPVPEDWQLKRRWRLPSSDWLYFALASEDLDSAAETLLIYRRDRNPETTGPDYNLDHIKRNAREECGDKVRWVERVREPNRVVVEKFVKGCRKQKDLDAIIAVLYGEGSYFIVEYQSRRTGLQRPGDAAWLELISRTSVASVPWTP